MPTPDHAAFVADARRHYVPAIRWARANGWRWRNGLFRNQEQGRSAEWSTDGDARPHVAVIARSEWGTWLRCVLLADVESCRQAVDILVDADILPPEMASWTGVYEDAIDFKGDEIWLDPDGRLQSGPGAAETDEWNPLYIDTRRTRAFQYGATTGAS